MREFGRGIGDSERDGSQTSETELREVVGELIASSGRIGGDGLKPLDHRGAVFIEEDLTDDREDCRGQNRIMRGPVRKLGDGGSQKLILRANEVRDELIERGRGRDHLAHEDLKHGLRVMLASGTLDHPSEEPRQALGRGKMRRWWAKGIALLGEHLLKTLVNHREIEALLIAKVIVHRSEVGLRGRDDLADGGLLEALAGEELLGVMEKGVVGGS